MINEKYMCPWADDENFVYVVDVENNLPRIAKITDATIVRRVYNPAALNHDLEGHYAKIEARGVPAIRKLLSGDPLETTARQDVIDFLDMHLERGRFADQAKLQLPGVRGHFDSLAVEDITFNLGDLLTLDRDLNPDRLRLSSLGLEEWPWVVHSSDWSLFTGDGAVILHSTDDSTVQGVTFPLSPAQLLVIGDIELPHPKLLNEAMADRSRRWIIGRPQDAPPGLVKDPRKHGSRSLKTGTPTST